MTLIFQTNADLQPHNSLAIPAVARSMVSVRSIDELERALTHAQQHGLSVLVLGEGSNTVFRNDFDGLVILNRLLGIDLVANEPDHVDVKVAAGENWHRFVETAIERGWYGLENLALIPGLVGAAPIQNIGAYGVEVSQSIIAVEYFTIQGIERVVLSNSECEFGYRDSIFKHALADQAVITSVTFRMPKVANCNISYPALAERLNAESTPRQLFDTVCDIRARKLPLPSEIPNAGSFFKNPLISADHYAALKARFPAIVGFEVANGVKLAAAWLIETAGWKNHQKAGVRVHQRQALVVTNPKHRTGQQVLEFAKAIQDDIAEKFAVDLEIEPRIY